MTQKQTDTVSASARIDAAPLYRMYAEELMLLASRAREAQA